LNIIQISDVSANFVHVVSIVEYRISQVSSTSYQINLYYIL
jgi:hypothetical protein